MHRTELLDGLRWALSAACAIAACTCTEAAPDDGVSRVLARVTPYVQRFVDRFSSVVAEEQYEQRSSQPARRRELRSDFLLVMFPGATEWVVYRDVLAVDGRIVRDQQQRLTTLFLEAPPDVMQRVQDIVAASTRYNLTDVGSLNNPLIALAFLQADYQSRFRFRIDSVDKKVGPGARILFFDERTRPTLLRTANNDDLPARGRIWIDDATGAVVKTELEVGGPQFPAQIVTSYAADDDLGIHVPTAMDEWYPRRIGSVTGRATYGRFRRFQVRTGEVFSR